MDYSKILSMLLRNQVSLFVLLVVTVLGCKSKEYATMIIKNANIYAVDTTYTGNTIAVRDDKIWKIGTWEDLENYVDAKTEVIDAGGNFVMPGFIEGHGHFAGLGYSLINLNFLKSKSWESIVSDVADKVKLTRKGDWIIGRGWHQEKWDSIPISNIYKYPFHNTLSAISEDNPVVLYHASGHALFANAKAMQEAGITKETPNPVGGEIVRDKSGNAIGVFEENAMNLITRKYDDYQAAMDKHVVDSVWFEAIRLAEEDCLKKGITSFEDAGSKFDELDKYEQLAKDRKLRVRIWAMMLHPVDEIEKYASQYKRINVGNHFYTCNAIKGFIDGALGSYGAWLLDPYRDKPGFRGQNVTEISDLKRIADIAVKNDLQFCVHAIGDKGNRTVLDIYEEVMKQHPEKKDWRWRIEHAQHLNPLDIKRFGDLKVIASMQGIHCTSDAPFVVERLGEQRAREGAYAWRSLIDNGAVVTNGTDTPIEDEDPIQNYYASVTRKREPGGKAFFPEQVMTRQEAIYAYTLGNAYAAFDDKIKGSIRPGKLADIVILSNDLINCDEDNILKTQVLYTIVGGKIAFKNR